MSIGPLLYLPVHLEVHLLVEEGQVSLYLGYLRYGIWVEPMRALEGMFISAESPTRSVRTAPKDEEIALIVVGEAHKTGEEPDTERRYRNLEEWARERFGVTEFENRWSSQDYSSFDGLPYVGRIGARSEHVYVATAFAAWGITNGTAAAMLLSDLIGGKENRWADLYDSTRTSPFGSKSLYEEGASQAVHFFKDRFEGATELASAIAPGEGRIVGKSGDQTAVYRDSQGEIHAVSARCTHLGCIVTWNPAETSWDCPCHGSRFSVEGEVLQSPAVRDLEKKSTGPIGGCSRSRWIEVPLFALQGNRTAIPICKVFTTLSGVEREK